MSPKLGTPELHIAAEWPELAGLQKDSGGWRASNGFRTTEDGRQEMIAQAMVIEQHAEALETVTLTLGQCSHGVNIPSAVRAGELRWTVNDYWAFARDARPTELVLTLWGFHWNHPEFCCEWAYSPTGPGSGALWPWA